MKKLSNRMEVWITALLAVIIMCCSAVVPVRAQGGYYNDGVSYQQFYDELAPYGQWLNDPQYGYVWAPNAGPDFRPYYTNGYWTMTEYGNLWVSNYQWGWAPFHYGRWLMSDYYGWIWIPGNEWGPAWVVWRQGGGYYGWAPMQPGISINISFGNGYSMPNTWWTFIPNNRLYSHSFHRYYAPRQTVNIINNTTIINNTYVNGRSRSTYVTGPRRSEVEAATRSRVPVYRVSDRTTAGAPGISGNNITVYRPRINSTTGNGQQRPAPRQVKSLDRSVAGSNGSRQAGNTGRQPATSSSSAGSRQAVRSSNNRTAAPVQQVRQQETATRQSEQQRQQQQQQQARQREEASRQAIQRQAEQQRQQQQQQARQREEASRQAAQRQAEQQRQIQQQQVRQSQEAAQRQAVQRQAQQQVRQQPTRSERSAPVRQADNTSSGRR